MLGEVLVDVPGAPLVGTGEGREADRRGEAGVVELGGNGIQASDQVPQASTAGQLGEGHSAELRRVCWAQFRLRTPRSPL